MLIPAVHWIFVSLLTCQIHSTKSFDLIGTIEKWLWSKTEIMKPRKIITGIEAEREYVRQTQQVNINIQSLERKSREISSTLQGWKDYARETNFIFRIIIDFFILPRWYKSEMRTNQELQEEKFKKIYEPFCDYHHYSHRLQYDAICQKAFQAQFFSDKKWILKSPNSTRCKHIGVEKIENNPSTNKPEILTLDRHARRCLAADESGKVEFYVFLVAGLPYNTSMTTRFPFFVFLEKDVISGKAFSTKYTFPGPYENKERAVAAYIE